MKSFEKIQVDVSICQTLRMEWFQCQDFLLETLQPIPAMLDSNWWEWRREPVRAMENGAPLLQSAEVLF